nr:unnamed protein product [Callosobruchus chinensis]
MSVPCPSHEKFGVLNNEYAFTTEEEDRLLQGSEEGFVDDETTSASWPKANQQATNLSAVQEASVTEVVKSKDSILNSDNNNNSFFL